MSEEIAISVQNLTKVYKLYDSPLDRLKESINPFGRKYHHDFYALKDVSFEIKKGETVGIIGKNGSGKSTLLKIITGVLTPTNGTATVNGKVSALLELGAGFNPELTGIENVYFNGTLMGYTREEMDAKLDDILSFADIGEFAHQPVKMYSSGMFVRLAFAVAVNVEPEILVVDEALSVGDVFFQQKCYAKIREMISGETTCLFVSHDMIAVMNICNNAILLDNGRIEFRGKPEEAVNKYSSKIGNRAAITNIPHQLANEARCLDDELMSSSEILDNSIIPPDIKRSGAGGLIVEAIRVVDKYGRDSLSVQMLESLYFYILLKAKDHVYDPSTGIHLYDRLGNLVFAVGTRQMGLRLPDLKPSQKLVVKMELSFNVQPGEYTFTFGASEPSDDGPNLAYTHDCLDILGPIAVIADQNKISPFYGIAQLPINISISKIINNEAKSGYIDRNKVLRQDAVRITWMINRLCNYKCNYCDFPQIMERKKIGEKLNSFDYYTVDTWLEGFKKFKQKKIYIKITGGEPFLDKNNLITLINGLSSLNNIAAIRIDTNGYWNPDAFLQMKKEKILLNISYHPTEVEFDKFMNNILLIRKAGFNIPMINFVLSPGNYPLFENYNNILEANGFLVNASVMIPKGEYTKRDKRTDEEIKIIKKYTLPIDVKYKLDSPQTKGRPCFHPSFSYYLNYDGKITVECLNVWSNFIKDALPILPGSFVKCPQKRCSGCLEMYRELADEPLTKPGKSLFTLDEFAEELHEWRCSIHNSKQCK